MSALLVGIIPIGTLLVFFVLAGVSMIASAALNSGILQFFTAFFLAGCLGSALMVGSLAVQALMAHAVIARERGDPVSLRSCLGASFGRVLPLLGLSLLMTMGMMLGFMFLLFPGVLLAIYWSVAAPTVSAERLGPIAALRRSHVLTKGNRRRIFGIMAIFVVLYLIGSSVVEAAMPIVHAANGMLLPETGALSIVTDLGNLVFSLAIWTLCVAFWGAISASLYLELRTIREGPLNQSLVEIFA